MKTLTDYIFGVKQNYKYKLKFAFSLSDCEFDAIERALQRYDLVKVGSIVKTPFEKNPRDFPTIAVSEVYIIDIETAIPMSTTVVRQSISQYTLIPIDRICVCDENISYKEYDRALIAAEEEKYIPKITDPYETDGTETINVHGQEHNEELVKAIQDASVGKPENPWKLAIKTFKVTDLK